jgi:hypothetical protein
MQLAPTPHHPAAPSPRPPLPQGFKPEVHPKAVCYDGPLLLEQFSTPYPQDGAQVERAYPWLTSHDGGCAAANVARRLERGQSLWSSGQYV